MNHDMSINEHEYVEFLREDTCRRIGHVCVWHLNERRILTQLGWTNGVFELTAVAACFVPVNGLAIFTFHTWNVHIGFHWRRVDDITLPFFTLGRGRDEFGEGKCGGTWIRITKYNVWYSNRRTPNRSATSSTAILGKNREQSATKYESESRRPFSWNSRKSHDPRKSREKIEYVLY